MKRSLNNALALIAIVMGQLAILGGDANAAAILAPISASTTMGELFPAVRAINKSGLSVGYTSLVTDFDVYIAAGRTATHGSGTNIWGSTLGVRSGNFDLALGATYLVSSMAFWNLFDDPSSVREFTLLMDDNSAFSSPVNLGTFTASNSLGSGSNTTAQVFTFPETAASFVRLQILNTWYASSSHTAFNEVAFKATPVPEPNVCLLLVVALLVIAVGRRRSSSQHSINAGHRSDGRRPGVHSMGWPQTLGVRTASTEQKQTRWRTSEHRISDCYFAVQHLP
jgi:hypothetical protein